MKRIKEHILQGVFEPDMKMRAREHFERIARDQIIENGYVPVVTRDTEWFTQWEEEKDRYWCQIVVYCVFVGKRKAREEIAGWDEAEGRWIKFNGQLQ